MRYPRGPVLEQYVVGQASLEQQFILAEPLPLRGAELVVRGRIESEGRFERTERGGRWRTDRSEVTLGEVRVFDATGAQLPATWEVTAGATRLAVDGPALARAVYPVTIDPEIGANDFRISDMGPDGNVNFGRLRAGRRLQQRRTTSTWWSGRGTTTPRPSWTTSSRSSASGSTRPRAPRSAPTTSASATWGPTATRPSTP